MILIAYNKNITLQIIRIILVFAKRHEKQALYKALCAYIYATCHYFQ